MTDRELLQDALDALTYVGDAKDIYSDTIDALRARLSQPEQELLQDALEALEDVPYMSNKDDYERLERVKSALRQALRARLAQPEPKPVAKYSDIVSDGGLDPRNTAPPQREWQGLTDAEVMSLLPGVVRLPPEWVDTVRAIEAKLKEKNT